MQLYVSLPSIYVSLQQVHTRQMKILLFLDIFLSLLLQYPSPYNRISATGWAKTKAATILLAGWLKHSCSGYALTVVIVQTVLKKLGHGKWLNLCYLRHLLTPRCRTWESRNKVGKEDSTSHVSVFHPATWQMVINLYTSTAVGKQLAQK